MSRAATALFRALIARSGVAADRILLMDWRSVDWQSLTFIGERHQIGLRITGEGSDAAAARFLSGLSEAEFAIPGHLVADIVPIARIEQERDGSRVISLEALTIEQ
jgi:hypothetical protein